MDPAVAALDFAKAGAIIANMIESYLAAGASPFNAEGADHAEPEDCRSSSDAKSLHLHSSIDNGASAIQSGEHRAPIQSSRSSEVAWLDAGADPNPRRGSCPVGRTDDQARRLQDPCERCGDGTSRRDLLSGIFTLGTLEQGLASITGTVRRHQDIGVRRRWLLRSVRLQRQPCPRHERHVRASRTAHHRARLHGAKLNRAQKGELRFPLPVGLVFDGHKIVLDPDQEVQGAVRTVFTLFEQEKQRLCCGSPLPPNRPSLSASIVRRCMGWQTHLGSVDPFAGARRSGESILRRHLRVWPLSILQEDRPHRRDLHSIAPDATRSVACCYSGPPFRLHHLGSIPRQSQSPRSEPDQQRSSRWACARRTLLAARHVALWHLRAASEHALYREWRPLPKL